MGWQPVAPTCGRRGAACYDVRRAEWGDENVSGDEELLQENVKLLMGRERELLSLQRKQLRFEAWLSLARSLATLVESTADRNRILRRVSDAFKSKLYFQQVAFFETAGTALVSIRLDPDVECLAGPVGDRTADAVFAAKTGRSSGCDDDEAAAPGALCFHRFLWHWIDAADPPALLVAGYDRERAEFYPPFDETDFVQFAMIGRELDLLLGNVAPMWRHDRPEKHLESNALLDGRMGAALPSLALSRRDAAAAHALTGRELEVSRLLARGKTNKEIAARLGISSRTVQTHVANIFDKLGVRNRAGAATWLVEHQVAV